MKDREIAMTLYDLVLDNPERTSDLVSNIIAFEYGQMEAGEQTRFFQELIDTGLAWQLKGPYTDIAKKLVTRDE